MNGLKMDEIEWMSMNKNMKKKKTIMLCCQMTQAERDLTLKLRWGYYCQNTWERAILNGRWVIF